MRGIELKHIGVRSFMLKGLTAQWGNDGNRPPMPPALRAALVAWYNTEIQKATNFDVIEAYVEDFTNWNYVNARGAVTVSRHKFIITECVLSGLGIVEDVREPYSNLTVHITGITDNQGVIITDVVNKEHQIINTITEDGIYTIEDRHRILGFGCNFVGTCNITIEQLPTSKLSDLSGNGHHLHLYGYTGTPTNGINADGWLQSAAVGYGVSYGQPSLTDYTLCMTRSHAMGSDTGALASKALVVGRGAFIFEVNCSGHNNSAAYSRGTGTHVTYAPTGFVYQTKDSYNGTPITAGTAVDADMLMVGGIRAGDPRMYKGSYKSFVLFNRTLTTEELAYVKRWMA